MHIADVSYFVRHNTALDIEALSRATTVYLVQKVSSSKFGATYVACDSFSFISQCPTRLLLPGRADAAAAAV